MTKKERDIKVKEIWDSKVSDLVEDYFPKGQCKERGKAMVLVARIYCEVLLPLNALYKPSLEDVVVDETSMQLEILSFFNSVKEIDRVFDSGGEFVRVMKDLAKALADRKGEWMRIG